MKPIDNVWRAYAATKEQKLRDQIILEYSHIVKYVAGRLSIHIGQHVEFEDMLSYGIFGLIDAIDKFDYNKGVKFETYASVRVRGAIIDNIRKMDWVPRTLRQKSKQLDTAYANLEGRLGREPTEAEMATELNISLEETQELIRKASVLSLVSLDDYDEQNKLETLSVKQNMKTESPESIFEQKEAKKMLTEAIEKLSEKEKKVIALYYFEELTLKEISNIMSVSESRISQIHTKAVMQLRTKLGKYKSLLMI